jgi:anti-sigma factor ChrR (cupin superfamily)
MKRLVSLLSAVVLVSSLALAARAADAPTIVLANQEKYAPAPAPFPAGCQIAVLSGDPSKAGSQYTVRLKLPDGARIGAHTHGDTEDVTVVSGTLMVAVGTTFDASHMLALSPGSLRLDPVGNAALRDGEGRDRRSGQRRRPGVDVTRQVRQDRFVVAS